MRDYLELYLDIDVLLLADIFENHINMFIENYGLDPLHYYTAPGVAWDALLEHSRVRLELISNQEMFLFLEKKRGGISTITHRHSVANNKCMGQRYNPKKKSKFILYLDANNIYGWAMSHPLPTHNFEWMSEEELKNWESLFSQEGKGCILEVDLEYSKTLHNAHSEYPFAAERIQTDGSKVKK